MNAKEIAEIIAVKGSCSTKLEGIQFEFLAQLVINTNEIVRILKATQPGAQMELPLEAPKAPVKAEEKKAEAPVAKPAAVKKAAPAKAAPVAEAEAPAAPTKTSVLGAAPKAEVKKELPSKEEVMSQLVDFIEAHQDGPDAGEAELAGILKELGGYTQFPEVPQEQYPALIEAINQ